MKVRVRVKGKVSVTVRLSRVSVRVRVRVRVRARVRVGVGVGVRVGVRVGVGVRVRVRARVGVGRRARVLDHVGERVARQLEHARRLAGVEEAYDVDAQVALQPLQRGVGAVHDLGDARVGEDLVERLAHAAVQRDRVDQEVLVARADLD